MRSACAGTAIRQAFRVARISRNPNIRRNPIRVHVGYAHQMVKAVLTIEHGLNPRQNGLITEKNLLSQPWRPARATSPFPVKALQASATRVDSPRMSALL